MFFLPALSAYYVAFLLFRYEKAICEYERCLQVYQKSHSSEDQTSESSSSLNSSVLEFIINEVWNAGLYFICSNVVVISTSSLQVADCYTKLTDWSEVEQWQKTVQEIRSRLPNSELQHAANIKTDMNYIR